MTDSTAIKSAFAIIAACALVSTAVFVRSEVQGKRQPVASARSDDPKPVEEWRQYMAGGNALGSSKSDRAIIVFSDFQCPFCRRFAAVLDSAIESDSSMRVIERHFPLTSIHAMAYTAALAAECGASVGRYHQVRNTLYQRRIAVEDGDWGTVARLAGVTDTAAFSKCVRSDRFTERVDRDLQDAERLGLRSTPSILINGKLYRGTLSVQELHDALSRTGG